MSIEDSYLGTISPQLGVVFRRQCTFMRWGLAGGGESLRNKYKDLYPSLIQYLSLMVGLPKCEEPQLPQ